MVDASWKCLTTHDGMQANQDELASLRQDSSTTTADDSPGGAGRLGHEAAEKGEHDEASGPPPTCPRCGSANMMCAVTVQEQGERSDGRLKVIAATDPVALIFNDRLSAELLADICGACGHVELRVENPAELYEHYRSWNT